MADVDLAYYTLQSLITDPGKYASLFDKLPESIPELVKVVQGLVIDKDLMEIYGENISSEQINDSDTRYVEKIIEIILGRNKKPLSVKRPLKERFVGSCRDYAILLCSILRHKKIPARLRCGFDNYFHIKPDFHDDHWVCEYWNVKKRRWVLVDANVDGVVRRKYNIAIDTLDLPRSSFFTAEQAWQLCRSGKEDPANFGVSAANISGLWFIRGSVVRDLAALNKFESLPWDYWGISDKAPDDLPESDLRLLDSIALLIEGGINLDKIRAVYQGNNLLRVPSKIKSYSPLNGLREVEIKGVCIDNPNVEVRNTKKYGCSLFAASAIKKDTVIADWTGGRVYKAKSASLLPNNSPLYVRDHAIQFKENKFIDYDGIGRYFAHSCNPNCGFKGRFLVVAMRKIKKGEELTFDYEMSEDSDWRMECKCQSKSCRKTVGAFRNMPPSVRKKYGNYISQWLREKYRI